MLIQFLHFLVSKLNLRILKRSSFINLINQRDVLRDRIELIKELENQSELLKLFDEVTSQLGQELFVLSILNFKRNGVFIEFGAADGHLLSNTFILEKNYQWSGVLVEPAKIYHERLKINRACSIDKRAVFSHSGESLFFNETNFPELSTIRSYGSEDEHKLKRKKHRVYTVESISLNDLINHHDLKVGIDYISIDTEGSELDILKSFDFLKYKVKVFTIEHNFTKNKKDISDLMISNGYIQLYENLSKWDSWFVNFEYLKVN